MQPDRILYVQQTDLGRSLWSIDNRGRRQEIIQALAESDTYAVAATRYDGEDELVVVPAKTQVATLYSGIYGDTPESKVIARGVNDAKFAPDGHLLALTAGTDIRMYDLEKSEVERSFVLYSWPARPGAVMSMTWFDDHHVLLNIDGALSLSEFDGSNNVSFGKAYKTFPGYASSDNRYVIVYRPDGTNVKIITLQIR